MHIGTHETAVSGCTPQQSTAGQYRTDLVARQKTIHTGGDELSARYSRANSRAVFLACQAPRMSDCLDALKAPIVYASAPCSRGYRHIMLLHFAQDTTLSVHCAGYPDVCTSSGSIPVPYHFNCTENYKPGTVSLLYLLLSIVRRTEFTVHTADRQ